MGDPFNAYGGTDQPGEAPTSWYKRSIAGVPVYAIGGVAAAAAVVVTALKLWPKRDDSAPPLPAAEAAARQADVDRAKDEQAAGKPAQPSFLAQGVPLKQGEWRQSPNRAYFLLQSKTGALSLYRGTSPSDPAAVLIHTSGITSIPDTAECFTLVQSDGNVCTYEGTLGKVKAAAAWCSYSQVADAKSLGELSLHVTDEGRLVLRGVTDPKRILWETPIVTNILHPLTGPTDTTNQLRVGTWLRSENGKYFMIQQRDGSLEIYEGNNPRVPKENLKFVWKSTKAGPDGDYYSVLSSTGVVSTYKGKGTEGYNDSNRFWQSDAFPGTTNAALQLTNDGGLSIIAPSGNRRLNERGGPSKRVVTFTAAAAAPRRGPPMPGTPPARGLSPAQLARQKTTGLDVSRGSSAVISPARPAASRPAAVSGGRGPSPAALARAAA